MIRILLIRHGATDLLGRVLYGRMPGVHLNSAGVQQAQALAHGLRARYRLDGVISSPMDRALETARPIAEIHGLEVLPDEAFTEIDFGDWMGKPFSELHDVELWERYYRFRATTRPPGGESMMDVQSRAWDGIARILDRHAHAQEPTVAVVTHGDVIRALLLLVLGMSIDHIQRIEAAPASVSEILIRRSDLRVRTMNETFSADRLSDL
ncbi:MAG TPA: histidine phosphatase family protein [Bryobacteraceae bacterium]|nr:histidine phosphatase family protein [Bryobacteraceae bacterium]